MPGVIRTRVGYTGGTKKNPTYYSLGDHTETLEVDFDPSVISCEEVLMQFWSSHRPTRRPYSRQYMSAIFYHTETQRQLAEITKKRFEAAVNGKAWTEIRPVETFYLAEDYHQKYLLQQTPKLMREIKAMYPHISGVVNSTAAARLNGYAGGYGSPALLQAELNSYGLSPNGQNELKKTVERFNRYR